MGRLFGFLGLVIVLAVGMYIYSAQMKNAATVGGGSSPTGAVNITGVKSDLLSIAQAERTYYASQGKYGSLDDLISGNYLTVKRERPPFTYDIQTSESGFRVVATRSDKGAPKEMSIDETMQIATSE